MEGLAVMTAQGGVARFSLSAVQDAQATVRSRAYLRVPDGGVSIAYEAHDDHGLREIHLVFRSGS